MDALECRSNYIFLSWNWKFLDEASAGQLETPGPKGHVDLNHPCL